MSTNTSSSIHEANAASSASDLLLILLFALAVRLLLANGLFGSDDVVYFARAAQLADGEWTSANYNGALRYGFNIPAAFFIALFGKNEIAANLWPLCCSLIEIGAVYVFASSAMGRRVGAFAALLLACAPLHIAVATRIHADPVVSMFLTLSFVLLYFACRQRQAKLFFSSGLAIGGIFWAKELAGVTWFALLPMLWFLRGQWRNCLYVIAGVSVMMLLHGALMWFIAGDPLHAIKVVLGAVQRNFIDGGDSPDGPFFYLRYLFVDLRHIGLIGFLAAASVALLRHRAPIDEQQRSGLVFALTWLLGLLVILSLFPVSLSPLRLTMKQSNYISLFLAPMAVLAGMTIAVLPRVAGQAALLSCLTLGLLLGSLAQADYRVFAANSKAVAAFVAQHPQAQVVGSSNNGNLGNTLAALDNPGSKLTEIISFRDLGDGDSAIQQRISAAGTVFAVLDQQTMSWYPGSTPISTPLSCWRHEQTLEPLGLGLGNELAGLASRLLVSLKPLSEALARLARPRPADVYRVVGNDVLCAEG